MIKSNILKIIPYPDEFTEDDKLEYDTLYAQAKVIHTDIERDNPFIIHMSIIAHIRAKKGMEQPFTNEELEEIKNSYILKSTLVECNEPEDHYIYDKENNPMFFPATITISNDENNSNVIIEA